MERTLNHYIIAPVGKERLSLPVSQALDEFLLTKRLAAAGLASRDNVRPVKPTVARVKSGKNAAVAPGKTVGQDRCARFARRRLQGRQLVALAQLPSAKFHARLD